MKTIRKITKRKQGKMTGSQKEEKGRERKKYADGVRHKTKGEGRETDGRKLA